jgi:hypothetical protein
MNGERLSTGLPILDKVMSGQGQHGTGTTIGGMLKSDTTVLLAPQNTGKTSTLISVACANVLAGKSVMFMSHEGNPGRIKSQFLSYLVGYPFNQLHDYILTEEGQYKIKLATDLLDKHLVFYPYNRAGMVVEEVVPIIRLQQDIWAAQHQGNGFDLFISDYPALLSTNLAAKGNMPKRNIDEIVYDNYVQLALEYKFHALLAIQSNREAAKINKGLGGENRLLQGEDVQESFAPIQRATNVLTLNRSPEAQAKNLITFYLSKSRDAATGWAVLCRTNFLHTTVMSQELGGIAYQGTRSLENNAEGLFSQYKNNFLDQSYLMHIGMV